MRIFFVGSFLYNKVEKASVESTPEQKKNEAGREGGEYFLVSRNEYLLAIISDFLIIYCYFSFPPPSEQCKSREQYSRGNIG